MKKLIISIIIILPLLLITGCNTIKSNNSYIVLDVNQLFINSLSNTGNIKDNFYIAVNDFINENNNKIIVIKNYTIEDSIELYHYYLTSGSGIGYEIWLQEINNFVLPFINQSIVYNTEQSYIDSNVIVSIVSVIVAFIIGIFQIIQNQKSNKFIKRQDARDENRRKNSIITEANNFIIKYNDTLELLPLCLCANMYNNHRPYHRVMYTEFNCLSIDVQDEILRIMDININRFSGDFYEHCYNLLYEFLEKYYPDDIKYNQAMLYEYGKYLYYSINEFSSCKTLPTKEKLDIMNIVSKTKLLKNIWDKYNTANTPNSLFSDVINTTMYAVVQLFFNTLTNKKELISNSDDNEVYNYDKYIPTFADAEVIYTMEDTFLRTLLAVYLYLDLNNS